MHLVVLHDAEVPAELALAFEVQFAPEQAYYSEELPGLFGEVLLFGAEQFGVDVGHDQYFVEQFCGCGQGLLLEIVVGHNEELVLEDLLDDACSQVECSLAHAFLFDA